MKKVSVNREATVVRYPFRNMHVYDNAQGKANGYQAHVTTRFDLSSVRIVGCFRVIDETLTRQMALSVLTNHLQGLCGVIVFAFKPSP